MYTIDHWLINCKKIGLWLTDLAHNQIMQENVDAAERGAVAGVQSSLNQICDLVKFLLVIALSEVQYFGYLVIISLSSTILTGVLYSVYAVKEKHRVEYDQVPISEAGPFRKSMIQIVRNNDSVAVNSNNTDANNNNNEDNDSYDSFDEEPRK